jgi:hypothetical protein
MRERGVRREAIPYGHKASNRRNIEIGGASKALGMRVWRGGFDVLLLLPVGVGAMLECIFFVLGPQKIEYRLG